ncbi:minor capsid protein [Lactobacillus intestinalis]|uniref:minor capsid protein n=1 Tax=Lactobacillus intestinalis TaxID=151781 RepID=UPI00272BDE5B|nr:minor capsid protein [Lactobacillus intestinalis]
MLKPPLSRCNQTVTVYRKIEGSNSHYHSTHYEEKGTVVNHAVVTLRSSMQATTGGNKILASGIVKFIKDRSTPFLNFSKNDIGAKIEYNGIAYTIQTVNEDRDPYSNEFYQYKLLIL